VLLPRPPCGGGAVDFFSEVEHIPSPKNRLSGLIDAQVGTRIFDSQPERCVKGADDEQSSSSQRPLLIAGVGVSLSRVLNSTVLLRVMGRTGIAARHANRTQNVAAIG